jgi:hypothetical protein
MSENPNPEVMLQTPPDQKPPDTTIPEPVKQENTFKFLTGHFFKGTVKGQILSIWKKRTITDRVQEYKQTLEKGLCKLELLTKIQYARLAEMGVPVPEEYKPVKKTKSLDNVKLTVKQVARLETFGIKCPEEMSPLPRKPRTKKIVEAILNTSTSINTNLNPV